MKPAKLIGLGVLALLIGVATIETGPSTNPIRISLLSPAEAKVGRPLTPVSVAGVSRRTARRCASGVYNC